MHLNDKESFRSENNELYPIIFDSLNVPTQKPRTTIYLEPELFQALEERAKEEKRTISNLCNLLIEQAMKAWLEQQPRLSQPIAFPSTERTETAPSPAAKAKRGNKKETTAP